jgi:hypothetical protein
MTALSSVAGKVRDTTQDEDASSYRVSDTKLTGYANDFVRELALLRPDLFATIGEIPCVDATVLQVAPGAALVLMDILQVKNGAVVTESKRAHFDRFNRTWMTDTAAAAESWMPDDKDPRRFFIYPKSTTGQVLIGKWAELPAEMADLNATIPSQVLPALYPAMHHYMVFRIEAKDDEYAVSGRAKLFYDAFAALVGAEKATTKEAKTPEKESGD